MVWKKRAVFLHSGGPLPGPRGDPGLLHGLPADPHRARRPASRGRPRLAAARPLRPPRGDPHGAGGESLPDRARDRRFAADRGAMARGPEGDVPVVRGTGVRREHREADRLEAEGLNRRHRARLLVPRHLDAERRAEPRGLGGLSSRRPSSPRSASRSPSSRRDRSSPPGARGAEPRWTSFSRGTARSSP